MKKLIIIGAGGIAHTIFEVFAQDTQYEICAFAMEERYIKNHQNLGLPVVALENIEQTHSPCDHHFFVGIGGNQLNGLRTRFYELMKAKGYAPASCISSKASISPSAKIGEHCCILENVVIHAGCDIGNNVIIYALALLGEYVTIEDNCFVAGHVSLAGYSHIGKSCYLGTNVSVLNAVHFGDGSVAGAGSIVTKNTASNTMVRMPTPNYYEDADVHFSLWFEKVSSIARQKRDKNQNIHLKE